MAEKNTIIILVHNELEALKPCIYSIRAFEKEVDNLSIIVADNASNDGVSDWLIEQEDISAAYFEDEIKPWGQVLNEIIEGFQLNDTNLMVMLPNFILTRGCLASMKELLSAHRLTGAVGPVSNGFSFMQQPVKPVNTYEEALELAESEYKSTYKKVIGLDASVVLFSMETIIKTGLFDENVCNLDYVITDYLFRMINGGFEIRICTNAVFYALPAGKPPSFKSADKKAADMDILRKKWGMQYFFSFYRSGILSLLEKGEEDTFSVLEVGCDCGASLVEIQNRYPNAELFGLELNPKAAAIASHVAKVDTGNIEDQNVSFHQKFDFIIFADVLEHLHNPEKTLLYCRDLLKEDGCIIASIPNIQHISVIQDLLDGNFTYQEEGLLDKTHIHFFTYIEILRMFTKCQFKVETVGQTSIPITQEQEKLMAQLKPLAKNFEETMFQAYQYYVRCRKVQ